MRWGRAGARMCTGRPQYIYYIYTQPKYPQHNPLRQEQKLCHIDYESCLYPRTAPYITKFRPHPPYTPRGPSPGPRPESAQACFAAWGIGGGGVGGWGICGRVGIPSKIFRKKSRNPLGRTPAGGCAHISSYHQSSNAIVDFSIYLFLFIGCSGTRWPKKIGNGNLK